MQSLARNWNIARGETECGHPIEACCVTSVGLWTTGARGRLVIAAEISSDKPPSGGVFVMSWAAVGSVGKSYRAGSEMRKIAVPHSQVNKKEMAVHVPTVSSTSLSIVVPSQGTLGKLPRGR